MSPLTALLLRDMRIAVLVGGGALIGVLFFLAVVSVTPFAVGPDLALLKRIGPAILWLAALLASLLALDRLFASDHEDGSLDLILTGRAPLELVVAAKGLAHWLTTALPLVVAGPLPFGTPFTVLCALTLASLVIGPFAAAAALRLDME